MNGEYMTLEVSMNIFIAVFLCISLGFIFKIIFDYTKWKIWDTRARKLTDDWKRIRERKS